jgi:glycosyltransferase involved in cell wall biosynthesis
MAFTTMSQLPGVGRHTHTCINELCGKLPIFQIALGRSIRRIPAAIRNFLDSPESHAQAVTPVEEVAQHTPLVSVIIPVYNGERFIAAAIDHVRSQNYPAIELIVVDDGSQDRTADIVERSDSDIRFFRQENSGPAAARNRGLRDASGEFILFLDVDDFWPENTIQRLVSHMLQEPEMDVIRGYAQLVKVDHETGELTYDGNPKESFADYIGAAIYRRSVFGQVGLFDPTMLFGEDADWFTRAREQGIRMKRLEEVTLYVRRHGSNMTEGKNLVELNMLRIIKKALDRRRAGVNGLRK